MIYYFTRCILCVIYYDTRLEGKLNSFVPSAAGPAAMPADLAAGRSKWLSEGDKWGQH